MAARPMLVAGFLVLATSSATADLTTINFESDPSGAVPNGFMSAGSPLVSFSDTIGSDLQIGNFGSASIGQGLLVGDGGPDEGSLLMMSFGSIVDSLSLDFGNDQPHIVQFGNQVTLTAFLDGVFVGETNVAMNGDGAMNQSIAFSGAMFNSATLDFYLGLSGAEEVVDNIVFNAIPGPGTGFMVLVGIGALARSRKRTSGQR